MVNVPRISEEVFWYFIQRNKSLWAFDFIHNVGFIQHILFYLLLN
jgi:hypothetical protein